MKRILLVIVASLLPIALVAAEPQMSISVTLSAAPAGQITLGAPVTLTATPSMNKPIELPPTRLGQPNIRYTFSAQRTWPCADSTVIAQSVATKTVTWNPQKAGVYQISVSARIVSRATVGGLPTRTPQATASLPNYKVLPQAGWSGNVGTTFSPPSPATAPVSLNLQVTVGPPAAEGRWYRYQYWCTGGCQPGTAVKDNQSASTSFQMQIPNPAPQYRFDIGVDKVRQSDCTWEQSIVTHSNPYYYTVNP
jgi:hypothetical protein